MDDLIVKLNEKLDSAVKKLRDGNYDDHDILPALLWVLLEYNRSHRDNLERVRERTDKTSAEISGLAKTLQEECEKLRHQLGSIADRMGAGLKSLNEDHNQSMRQNAMQLEKLVEIKVDSLSEAHQSGVRRTDNKLKWILVGSILQIIFILIVIFLLFGK